METSTELGLVQGSVQLRDYTSRWAELYTHEAQRIRAVLGGLLVDVQHVGSTAIPGLKAKPILDIAVGIRRLEDALQCQAPLTTIGYEYAHWAGIEHNYVFGKGIARTHLIHVVEFDGVRWRNYLTFRNALRANADLRQEYELLKIGLAHQFPDNRGAYTSAKSRFIQDVIATSPKDASGASM